MKRRLLGGGLCRFRDEAGQAAFEFMLVLPFFFVFLFLGVQGASVFEQWSYLEHASREGARCVALRATAANVQSRVINSSGGLLSAGNYGTYVSISPSDPSNHTTVIDGSTGSVTVTGYPYTFGGTALASFLSLVSGGSATPATITLNASTAMRLENWSGSAGTCS